MALRMPAGTTRGIADPRRNATTAIQHRIDPSKPRWNRPANGDNGSIASNVLHTAQTAAAMKVVYAMMLPPVDFRAANAIISSLPGTNACVQAPDVR